MTLFLVSSKRSFEIHDAYVMLLSALLGYAITRIVKAVIEKQLEKRKNRKQRRSNRKKKYIPNPRGGDTYNLNLELTDDRELASTILSCIADDEFYIVRHPRIIKLIFALVKGKIKDESLALTPNMMRFLALKLIKNDRTMMVKVGNFIASSNNQARLAMRAGTSLVLGGFTAVAIASIPYALLMAVAFYDSTEYCGYNCSNYFEHLPKKESLVQVYKEKPTGHLIIGPNDADRQVEIYSPSSNMKEVSTENSSKVEKTKTYRKTRKKPKQVTFNEFKKTDAVLKSFNSDQEPVVPQQQCPFNNFDDMIMQGNWVD